MNQIETAVIDGHQWELSDVPGVVQRITNLTAKPLVQEFRIAASGVEIYHPLSGWRSLTKSDTDLRLTINVMDALSALGPTVNGWRWSQDGSIHNQVGDKMRIFPECVRYKHRDWKGWENIATGSPCDLALRQLAPHWLLPRTMREMNKSSKAPDAHWSFRLRRGETLDLDRILREAADADVRELTIRLGKDQTRYFVHRDELPLIYRWAKATQTSIGLIPANELYFDEISRPCLAEARKWGAENSENEDKPKVVPVQKRRIRVVVMGMR